MYDGAGGGSKIDQKVRVQYLKALKGTRGMIAEPLYVLPMKIKIHSFKHSSFIRIAAIITPEGYVISKSHGILQKVCFSEIVDQKGQS